MIYDDIKAHLQASGLMAAYTFQSVFNEQNWDVAKRYCVIRGVGGAGDKYVRNATFQIHFLAKVNDTALATLSADADKVLRFVLNNYKRGNLINFGLALDVSGPYYTDSGRMQYYFEVMVKSDDVRSP